MTHSNRVNQLAETFLLDFGKWLAIMEFLLFISFGDIAQGWYLLYFNGEWSLEEVLCFVC
jgi:hypothetical protein